VGWSEKFAQTWPVDAIVVENGAVALKVAHKNDKKSNQATNSLSSLLLKLYRQDTQTRSNNQTKMQEIAKLVTSQISGVEVSRDGAGRETDLAFDYNEFAKLSPATVQQVVALLQSQGMQTSVSSIHIHGCFGHFDKWTGAQWIVRELYKRELTSELDKWVFIGDSGNDQAMFQHFTHSVGVANIRRFEAQLAHLPRYITPSEHGAGFAEVAMSILRAK
jgi:hydroxymethylpyrimidine pyrophosphatase-like HAD family hydrolase